MEYKPLLVIALILAALGFVSEYAPLSQETLTTPIPTYYEKEVPYDVVSTLISSSTITRYRDIVQDASDDSEGKYDISEVIFEEDGETLITYMRLSHGKFEDGASFSIFIDSNGDEYAEYSITLLGSVSCYLVDYHQSGEPVVKLNLEYKIQSLTTDQVWIAWTPFSQIGGNEFYFWASANKKTDNQWDAEDWIPDQSEKKIDFISEYVDVQEKITKEPIRKTSTRTISSSSSSTITVRTTLREGNFIAFILFMIAGILAVALIGKSLTIKQRTR